MIWSLTLAAVGVFGLYISGKKNYWGWAIGLAAQVLWIAYAIVTQQWGFIISALAYGWVYGKNFLSWRKESEASPPRQGHYTRPVRPLRKWLYISAFNLVARLAPADVRAVHMEVFSRGFKVYEDARKVDVLLREDLR